MTKREKIKAIIDFTPGMEWKDTALDSLDSDNKVLRDMLTMRMFVEEFNTELRKKGRQESDILDYYYSQI